MQGDVDLEAMGTLTEKIAQLRKTVAAGQQIIGDTVHIGSADINTLSMMLDTIDLLGELARQCAKHAHPSTGQLSNAADFEETANIAVQTRKKYEGIIA